MSDFNDDIRATIEGAAQPVTIDEVVTPTTARAPSRQSWRALVAVAVVVALLVVGVIVVVSFGDEGPTRLQVAAPTVAVGDVDLAVLSTSFDSDGARGPLSSDLVDAVRSVPGVAGAQGVMQRFVEVVRPDDTNATELPASERSAIAISSEDGMPLTFSAGGPPQGAAEIAINQSLADQYGVSVGDDLALQTGMSGVVTGRVLPSGEVVQNDVPTHPTVRVAGVFSPAGGDVADINLVVMSAEDLGAATARPSFDRIDVASDGQTPIDELYDRIAASLPAGTMVVPPSVVGFDEQLRSELEIQRAYHWILNPDQAVRSQGTDQSVDSPEGEQNGQSYDRGAAQIRDVEFRVSRVAFVDSATALVTYRIYYAGQPATMYKTPMTGVAEKVDGVWRVSQASLCDQLAVQGDSNCAAAAGPIGSLYALPPNGWNPVDSVPGLADSFRVLADPASTVEQRVAAVDQGDKLRTAIEAGARADAPYAGKVSFTVSGARLLDATHAQLLYSVIADGDPRLETPYPFVGNAVLVEGTWRVSSRFACGLTALATLKCASAAELPTTTLPATSTSTSTTTTSTTQPVATTGSPTTVAPTTDPDAVEVPTTKP